MFHFHFRIPQVNKNNFTELLNLTEVYTSRMSHLTHDYIASHLVQDNDIKCPTCGPRILIFALGCVISYASSCISPYLTFCPSRAEFTPYWSSRNLAVLQNEVSPLINSSLPQCVEGRCVNPCAATENPCGLNAECKVVLHRAICNCPLGYFGNPITVRVPQFKVPLIT